MMTLGKKMRDLRCKRHYNQELIADKLGVSRSTYSNYENERRTPPNDALVILADYYQIPVEYLLRDHENYTAYPAIYNHDMQEFIRSYMELDLISQRLIRLLTTHLLRHKKQ